MTRVKGIAVAALVAFTLVAYAREAAAKPKGIGSCQTITAPGSYVLTKSLTAIGDCITVAANFVTIDLDNLVLTGDGTGTGITDGGLTRQGIVVRNGTITNFGDGISLASSTSSVIEKVRSILNTNNGMHGGGRSTISGNTASSNLSNGIVAGTNNTISGNTASGNGFVGIVVTANSTISGNIASSNISNGIDAGSDSTISGNTATGNSFHGIFAGNDSTITGNTASSNSGHGIVAGANNTISNNTASNNNNDGINVESNNTISNNTASGNNDDGIVATTNNTISNNTASGNGVASADGTGITATCAVNNVSNIVGNTAQDNDVNGAVAGCNLVNNVGF